MKTNIIPQIKEITLKTATLAFKNFFVDEKILKLLPIANEIFTNNQKGENLYPITVCDADLTHESYKISVFEKAITIYTKNGDARALMYALYTISELSIINDDTLTECEIFDEPTLKFRALSDDISRGQISTTKDFFSIIKKLARYKYNTFMPYMEDVYKFAAIPAWGRYSDGIDKEEWLCIIDFAKQYQMDVRPIVNLLGHYDKLSNIKELQQYALKLKDGTPSHCMDPKNPEIRKLIITMIDEIVDTFGEGLIHVGGDEPIHLTTVYGTEEAGTLFIDHYTFIANELKKRNCTCMIYADFFAAPWGDYSAPVTRTKELPDDVEFVFWDYGVRDEYPFIPRLHDQGIKLYISPGTWTWKRFACAFKTSFENTKGLLSADNGRSLGMIMSSWADGGDTLRELVWPGVVVGGNYCWSPNSTYSFDEFYEIYHKSFFGIEKAQADLLYNVYHYDYLVKFEHEHEFKNTMFADPFEPIVYSDKENVYKVKEAMIEAKANMETINPLRNMDAYNALKLAVARTMYTANKIMTLPHKKVTTIEEGIPYSLAAKNLAAELLIVKDLHRKLWYANNRNSEWDLCEIRYDDEYDRLNMFARNIRSRKMFNIHI